MKRLLLIALLTALTALTSWAGPARRGTFSATLADGTVVTLELVGDEHFHYYRNVATGQPMRQMADGTYVALDASTFDAGSKAGEDRRSAANARRIERLEQRRAAMAARPSGPNRVGIMKPASGKKKGLVILVNYSDRAINAKHSREFFYRMFNEEGFSDYNHIGSVHDYFYEQSYGQLDLTFDVVGPVTVSQTLNYYGQADSDGGHDKYPATMVGEACRLADEAGTDFSLYDWDGDGEVDQVFVIYAGYGEAQGAPSNTIWPHEWTLSSAAYYGDGGGALRLDGVKVNTYACSCELRGSSGSNVSPIGTACHEFSHCLGLPDFYDTSGGGSYGMNHLDLMDSGSYNGPTGYGEVPCGYTAYERWMAGWLTPTVLTEPKTVGSMPDIGQHPAAYVLYNSGTSNEYLLFENRKADRWFAYFGSSRPAIKGLFVTHVDYSSSIWQNNKVNNTSGRQRMSPVPAGKTYATSSSAAAKMFFPNGATALSESSHTSCGGQWFNNNKAGTKALGHSVTDIAFKGDSIAFKFDGGEPEDDGSRYTVTYDAGTGVCATASMTQTAYQQTFVLPTATSPVDGWAFAGWATSAVYAAKPATLLTAGSDYLPTADVTLHAVYVHSETLAEGSGYYERVTAPRDDWSGQYLIVMRDGNAASVADGRKGGENGIGKSNSGIATATAGYVSATDVYDPAKADAYSVKIVATDGGYLLQTLDGNYNYRAATATSGGITTTTDATKATPVTITMGSPDDVRILTGGGKHVFAYNVSTSLFFFTSRSFRFYPTATAEGYVKAGRTATLYRKMVATTLTSYTSYPTVTIGTLVQAIEAARQGTATPADVDTLRSRLLQQ